MVGDTGEDLGEPCLGIDVVEATGLYQQISDRRSLTISGRSRRTATTCA